MNLADRGTMGPMDIVGIDAIVVLLCGVFVWSMLMLGVEIGNAMTEAYARR